MITNATPKVTVVDGLMGSGKTHNAIARMATIASPFNTSSQRFIYVTPFLKEVTRVLDDLNKLGAVDVVTPKLSTGAPKRDDYEDDDGVVRVDPKAITTKSEHLYKLVAEGKNIVATHKLFEHLDPRVLAQIDLGNYVLIVDEVAQWVQKYQGMKLADVKIC